MGVVEAVSN